MNPSRYSEFSSYISSEVGEKLQFLQMAAKNSDYTEVEYIVDSLARFFSRFEFNTCYANTKQLEVSISVKSSNLKEHIDQYVATINRSIDINVDFIDS